MTHEDNYLDTREGRRLPVEHYVEGEDGWNFAPELEDAMAATEPEVTHIVNKPTFRRLYAAQRHSGRADGPQQGRDRY